MDPDIRMLPKRFESMPIASAGLIMISRNDIEHESIESIDESSIKSPNRSGAIAQIIAIEYIPSLDPDGASHPASLSNCERESFMESIEIFPSEMQIS